MIDSPGRLVLGQSNRLHGPSVIVFAGFVSLPRVPHAPDSSKDLKSDGSGDHDQTMKDIADHSPL